MANRAETPPKGEGKYNIIVIGAGTAGLVTAAASVGMGARVALIEKGKMGGDCLNFGCVPSKALLRSSKIFGYLRRAEEFGAEIGEIKIDFLKVLERMRRLRGKIEPNDSVERFESLGVDVFQGEARFKSPHEVEVDGRILSAANVVIATGGRPRILDVPGLKETGFHTNETIFDLDFSPKSAIVIGGGPIGCEFTQILSRAGVQVTLITDVANILPRDDPDAVEIVQRRFIESGVQFVNNAKVKSARKDGAEKIVEVETPDGNVEARGEIILVAVGRQPNIENLALENAGVTYTRRGVTVDDHLQTSQSHIYACGDVAGPYLFTHSADFQARVVIRNILVPIFKTRISYKTIMWCTYTDPEISHIGYTRKELQDGGTPFDEVEVRFDELDRAILEGEDEGFLKVFVDKKKGRILGADMTGPHAGDLICELNVARAFDIPLGKLSGVIHAYPTFAEICRKAADTYNRKRLTPMVARIFRWLYRRKLS
ncbi:mercuric reductase [Candidatus Sumerlaeota bacterium]|nr:mercuric reductase [Candidatus Sumerlaeota bacterium]